MSPKQYAEYQRQAEVIERNKQLKEQQNKKQTAVEWLMLNLHTAKDPFGTAKAMEKEQIEHSYLTCYKEYTAEGKHWEMGMNPKETFEQYYTETYES